MDKVAFILGAGAHAPFGFPTGNRLKELVADELQAAKASADPAFVPMMEEACRSLLDCGVSIDRFLAERSVVTPAVDDYVRPLIAKCLLGHENTATDTGM